MTTKELLARLQFSTNLVRMDEKIYKSRNELLKVAQDLGKDFEPLAKQINILLDESMHQRNEDPIIQFVIHSHRDKPF